MVEKSPTVLKGARVELLDDTVGLTAKCERTECPYRTSLDVEGL